MKQKNVKTAFAIACVVAASVSSFKAYDQHNKNVAAANMLLAENVEALSAGDGSIIDTIMGLFGYEPKKEYQYKTMGASPFNYMNRKTGHMESTEGRQFVCLNTTNDQATCILPNPNPCQ